MKMPQMIVSCPLCSGIQSDCFYTKPSGERYRSCFRCGVVFLEPQFLLEHGEEERRYLLHRNDIEDPKYRQFLEPVAQAISDRVSVPSRGLDFGCGPGPLLAKMLGERGYEMFVYDPQFFPHHKVLDLAYDFVTCTEVVEHFHRPKEEFLRLSNLLKPGGCLVVMTETIEDLNRFEAWHYHRDPTHVVFYGTRSFEYIRDNFGFGLLKRPSERIALFQK